MSLNFCFWRASSPSLYKLQVTSTFHLARHNIVLIVSVLCAEFFPESVISFAPNKIGSLPICKHVLLHPLFVPFMVYFPIVCFGGYITSCLSPLSAVHPCEPTLFSIHHSSYLSIFVSSSLPDWTSKRFYVLQPAGVPLHYLRIGSRLLSIISLLRLVRICAFSLLHPMFPFLISHRP